MNDNSITKNDFYLYEATYFESIDYYGALYTTEEEPEMHRAFIVNGIIFDLDTGQEVKLLSVDENNYVISEVYTCTPYLITGRLFKIHAEEVTDEDMQKANDILDNYFITRKLKSENKIIKFKGKRLY